MLRIEISKPCINGKNNMESFSFHNNIHFSSFSHCYKNICVVPDQYCDLIVLIQFTVVRLLKFMFTKKAIQTDEIFTVDLIFTT